jgi:hypothetical protein
MIWRAIDFVLRWGPGFLKVGGLAFCVWGVVLLAVGQFAHGVTVFVFGAVVFHSGTRGNQTT